MNAASPTLSTVLTGLIRDRGPGLLGERRRLLGLLRDRLPGDVRAIRILMMAFDGGVPGRLSGTDPTSPDIGREGGLLAAETGLAPEVARQAVETWAMALCGYAPASGAQDGAPAPRPQVRKLAPRPQAAPLAGGATAATVVAQRPPWTRRWPAIVLGLVVLLGGIARLVHQPDEGPAPQQPAAPAQPAPQPPETKPAAPAVPAAPAAPGVPAVPAAPGAPAAATTPEGYALVSGDTPYPLFATERVKQSPNTLGIWFGVKVGTQPVSYYVAFAFDKGQRHGQGLVGATQNGQKVGTGVIAADRIVETGTGKSFLRVAGPMQQNELRLPGLCAFAQVGDTLDRLDLAPDGLLAVFGLDQNGGCDMQNRIGFGTLK